jgi:hypothetical protein
MQATAGYCSTVSATKAPDASLGNQGGWKLAE